MEQKAFLMFNLLVCAKMVLRIKYGATIGRGRKLEERATG